MKTVTLEHAPAARATLALRVHGSTKNSRFAPRIWRSIARNGVETIRRQGQKTFFANTIREDQIGVRRERNIQFRNSNGRIPRKRDYEHKFLSCR